MNEHYRLRISLVLSFLCALPFTSAWSAGQGPGGEVIRRPPSPPVGDIKPGRTSASRIKAQVENEIKLANEARQARIQLSIDYILADESSEKEYNAKRASSFRREAAHYRRALALNPKEWRAYYGLGNTYLDQGLYARAVAAYNQALRYSKDNIDVYVALGDAYYQQLDSQRADVSDGAVRAYERAVRLGAKDSLVHYRLAHLYFEAGRNREAVEKYQTYFRLDYDGSPASSFKSKAHYELGLAYLKLGDQNAAMEQYRALKRLGANDSADALLKEINIQQ